jgi:hypothetical protein
VEPYLCKKQPMARKKWTPKTEITPALLKFREKRKWQIALRRYVLDKNPCVEYAPYFGLDIENLRQWFEYQFMPDQHWESFGKTWQFDHLIPVTCFDFSNEEELRLCWNFTNLRVVQLNKSNDRGNRLDLLAAKPYFQELFDQTGYPICLKLVEKINQLESATFINTDRQQAFILKRKDYLQWIGPFNSFEFELLNTGRSIEEVKKEIEILKGLTNPGE